MPLSDVRLVATDMDGTLLDPAGEVDVAFYPLYQSLKRHGVRFVAASGRQYYNMRRKLAPIADEITFAAENGSLVREHGQDLLVEALDPGLAHELMARGRTLPTAKLVLCGKKTAYIEGGDPAFEAYVRRFFERVALVADLLAVADDDFLKVTLSDFNGTAEHTYPHFRAYEGDLKVKVSSETWLDISAPKAHKGQALTFLQERWGVSPAQTMVFGDYLNDVEMMRTAEWSFAMANAHPDVKAAARHETLSNEAAGVTVVLRRLVEALEEAERAAVG
ncbi:MAG: Cof-type HAD-IIB family hydrolase [Catalinimonas sp.]